MENGSIPFRVLYRAAFKRKTKDIGDLILEASSPRTNHFLYRKRVNVVLGSSKKNEDFGLTVLGYFREISCATQFRLFLYNSYIPLMIKLTKNTGIELKRFSYIYTSVLINYNMIHLNILIFKLKNYRGLYRLFLNTKFPVAFRFYKIFGRNK